MSLDAGEVWAAKTDVELRAEVDTMSLIQAKLALYYVIQGASIRSALWRAKLYLREVHDEPVL
jgi:hypothetical protein